MSWAALFSLEGYSPYILGAYGLTLILLAIEVWRVARAAGKNRGRARLSAGSPPLKPALAPEQPNERKHRHATASDLPPPENAAFTSGQAASAPGNGRLTPTQNHQIDDGALTTPANSKNDR